MPARKLCEIAQQSTLHVNLHFLRTLVFLHFFLRNFLAHLRNDHLPGASSHKPSFSVQQRR